MQILCEFAKSWKVQNFNEETPMLEYLEIIHQLVKLPWKVLNSTALDEIDDAIRFAFSISSTNGLWSSGAEKLISILEFLQASNGNEDYKKILKHAIDEIQQRFSPFFFFFHSLKMLKHLRSPFAKISFQHSRKTNHQVIGWKEMPWIQSIQFGEWLNALEGPVKQPVSLLLSFSASKSVLEPEWSLVLLLPLQPSLTSFHNREVHFQSNEDTDGPSIRFSSGQSLGQ
jgi:hypothetical protein